MPLKHLIYGTFPDLPGSQQIIYRSNDFADDLADRLITFYSEFGDCKNSEFRSSLSVLWYESDSLGRSAAITKVCQHGRDFSGRWGALLRHTVILDEGEYLHYHYDPEELQPVFIASGTSEELAQFVEPVTPEPYGLDLYFEKILTVDFENQQDYLRRILLGERMELYAERNNEHTNASILDLFRLFPIQIKKQINWSEFLFRPLAQFDLSLCYAPRYEVPEAGRLLWVSAGDNHVKSMNLDSQWVDQYLFDLAASIHGQDKERLRKLIMLE
jgi:hypothetical protein